MSIEKMIVGMFVALGLLPLMTFWLYKLIPSLFWSYIISIIIFTGGILCLKRLRKSQ